MVKRTATKITAKRQNFAHKNTQIKKMSAEANGKKGSAFKKSKASTNPNRPDPSGGKKGS